MFDGRPPKGTRYTHCPHSELFTWLAVVCRPSAAAAGELNHSNSSGNIGLDKRAIVDWSKCSLCCCGCQVKLLVKVVPYWYTQ